MRNNKRLESEGFGLYFYTIGFFMTFSFRYCDRVI